MPVLKTCVFPAFFSCLAALLLCQLCSPTAAPADEDDPFLSGTLLDPRPGDLPDMEKHRAIRVLTVASLSNYYLLPGEAVGYEYAMLKDFETFLGKGRGNRDPGPKFIFIPVPYDRLLTFLLEGRGDLAAAGLTVTPEREAVADFTRPYIPQVNEVVVTNSAAPPVNAAEDLSGRTVLVLASSSYRVSLEGLNRQLADQGRPPVNVLAASEYLAPEDILEIVGTGAVEATVMDEHVATLLAKVVPGITVNHGAVLRRGGALAWMVRKESPLLKARLNAFLETHRKGTALGDATFRKVFEHTTWIRNPMDQESMSRFLKYKPWFQKYGGLYGVDWRLLACQAFRESGLDPKARSPEGHIGLFQLDPNLANHPKIGIKNLADPERNIQAGAKYLALIRDAHFRERELGPEEALRFSLAGYNAGPSRIVKARSSAEVMGFDANRWFGNGEIATMRTVGAEPVRYVSEINKYFLIYTLGRQFEDEKRRELERLGRQGVLRPDPAAE